MSQVTLAFIAAAAIVAGGLGYWFGNSSSGVPAPQAISAPGGKGRILFYRNPMGAPDTSPAPKKDSMGMDYIPVYENETAGPPGTVKIDLAKTQRTGVRTEAATLRKIAREVHAVGAVKLNEARVAVVSPRVEGWIERVHVGASGLSVVAGQPLVDIYSPELVQTQEEYILARKAMSADPATSGAAAIADGALERLQSLGLPPSQIRQIAAADQARRTLTLTAPTSGFVMEKNAVLGQRFMPGETLYRIADISAVWVVAKVPEQDLVLVRLGGEVAISVNAMPGTPLTGVVGFIAPEIDRQTRTADVRIDVPNPDGRLRAEMYATVIFAGGREAVATVAVPDSAIIDSGTRQVAIVAKADGLFEPRQVSVGSRANGYTSILSGIGEGETVVVNAAFLIDAESNLKAALQSFTNAPAAGRAP